MMVEFFCPGRPQTAGSKSSIPTKAGPRVIEAGSKESRARKKTWRGDLRDAAIRAAAIVGRSLDGTNPWFDEPVQVAMVIVRRRPSTHVGTGRNAGVVKAHCRPLLPTERPDTVKMVRAAEDALTGFLWADDSQIVHHQLFKAFADQVGLPPAAEGLFVRVTSCGRYAGPPVQQAA